MWETKLPYGIRSLWSGLVAGHQQVAFPTSTGEWCLNLTIIAAQVAKNQFTIVQCQCSLNKHCNK